jgi:hypothetical protein
MSVSVIEAEVAAFIAQHRALKTDRNKAAVGQKRLSA